MKFKLKVKVQRRDTQQSEYVTWIWYSKSKKDCKRVFKSIYRSCAKGVYQLISIEAV